MSSVFQTGRQNERRSLHELRKDGWKCWKLKGLWNVLAVKNGVVKFVRTKRGKTLFQLKDWVEINGFLYSKEVEFDWHGWKAKRGKWKRKPSWFLTTFYLGGGRRV